MTEDKGMAMTETSGATTECHDGLRATDQQPSWKEHRHELP